MIVRPYTILTESTLPVVHFQFNLITVKLWCIELCAFSRNARWYFKQNASMLYYWNQTTGTRNTSTIIIIFYYVGKNYYYVGKKSRQTGDTQRIQTWKNYWYENM